MPPDGVGGPVSETGPRPRKRLAALGQGFQAGVEGERSQGDENRRMRQERELAVEVAAAVVELPGQRTIRRRSAAARRRQEGVVKLQPVVRRA